MDRESRAPDRRPVDDPTFTTIADLFQYDPTLTWSDRTPCTYEKVYYQSVHGESVPGYFAYPSAKDFKSAPGILLVHGSNSFWGINEDWVRDWIEVLTVAGYCVLAIDNFGFGERMKRGTGHDDKVGTYKGRDMVIQSVTDLRRGIDYLASRPEVIHDRIALVGGSRGCWLGVLASALEKRHSASVLVVTAHVPPAVRAIPCLRSDTH